MAYRKSLEIEVCLGKVDGQARSLEQLGNLYSGVLSRPTLVAQILKISSSYTPPPEGFVSPMTWGSKTT
jgi:hypothetical protein